LEVDTMTTTERLRPLPPPALDAEDRLHQLARERLEARRGFFTHLAVYLSVNVMLWGIWFVTALTSHTWFPWPVFPSLGWGVGLAMNAWAVFAAKPITDADVAAEAARLRDRR
jgi:hypothetical protein